MTNPVIVATFFPHKNDENFIKHFMF